MNHRPVCVKCQCEMKPEKNGVQVIEIAVDRKPYEIWDADKWKCPICGIEIMLGFSGRAWTNRAEAGFEANLEKVYAMGGYVECR